MPTKKQAVDQSGTCKSVQKAFEELPPEQQIESRGIGGDSLIEPCPQYIKSQNEKVIENGHNAAIVLGRDRPAGRLSGYGGKGDTHCASIDLVVGRMGFRARTVSPNGKRVWTDPNFETDAARIQQTDHRVETYGASRVDLGKPALGDTPLRWLIWKPSPYHVWKYCRRCPRSPIADCRRRWNLPGEPDLRCVKPPLFWRG